MKTVYIQKEEIIFLDDLRFDKVVGGIIGDNIFIVEEHSYESNTYNLRVFATPSPTGQFIANNCFDRDKPANVIRESLKKHYLNGNLREIYQFDSMKEFCEWAIRFLK